MHLGLIGVPTNSAGTTDGVARGPGALREAGLVEFLGQMCDVTDYGDVHVPPAKSERSKSSGIIADESMSVMIDNVKIAVSKAIEEGRFPLVIGGDCPILIGCLGAIWKPDSHPGLLFVDGHEDAYPPHQSPTGEAADMELGILLGRAAELPAKLEKSLPRLLPSDVVLFGPRDENILRSEGVQSLSGEVEMHTDRALIEGDLERVVAQALERLRKAHSRLWLHVDLDVLSTAALPAVDYCQPGGLGWEDLKVLTEVALRSGAVAGWDMTIYNPDLDASRVSARHIVEYVGHALGSLAVRHVEL